MFRDLCILQIARKIVEASAFLLQKGAEVQDNDLIVASQQTRAAKC